MGWLSLFALEVQAGCLNDWTCWTRVLSAPFLSTCSPMNLRLSLSLGLTGLLLGALPNVVDAQLVYSVPGAVLQETFTNPDGWGTDIATQGTRAWANDSTIPGWHAAYYVNSTDTYTYPTNSIVSNGSQGSSHSLYVFRFADTENPTVYQDGALGAIPVNAQTGGAANVGGVFYGTQILNNTGIPLTQFSLSYVMEIWRLSANAVANSLTVSYRIGGTEFGAGTWTAIPDLTTTSPTGDTATVLFNGNLTENRLASGLVTVTDVLIPAGTSIWIRWFDQNDTGVDNGIGIDDVSFTAIPEPLTSSFAALVGVIAIAVGRYRRRR